MIRPLSAPILALPLALALAALPVAARAAPEAAAPPAAAPSVSATGKTMPPAGPRAGAAPVKAATAADLQKAQREAETRNKAWDSRMHKTMGSICKGC